MASDAASELDWAKGLGLMVTKAFVEQAGKSICKPEYHKFRPDLHRINLMNASCS